MRRARDRTVAVLPATTVETYRALRWAVETYANLQSADDFSKPVTFATNMTAWASGSNISAHAVPIEGGTAVRMDGQAKMRSQIKANNPADKQCVYIFDDAARAIQCWRRERE